MPPRRASAKTPPGRNRASLSETATVDRLSTAARSALMARIGPRNSKPEMIVRRLLHSRGWRYRLHRKDLPGTPDLVFPRLRKVIFVNGCFWHGHTCRLGRLPSTRSEFWSEKIEGNRARDARKTRALIEQGWDVHTVWQCHLKDIEELLVELELFLRATIGSASNSEHGSV